MKLIRAHGLRDSALLVGGILVNTWGLSWLPFDKLHLSPFWYAVAVRGASSLVTLIGIFFFCPGLLKRLKFGGDVKRVGISLLVVAYLIGPAVVHTNYRGVTVAQIFESFVFALFIGIEEDFFARGYVFGVLERYGVWFAAIVSSMIFGLSHLTNIVWGHQSAAYTLAQAVSAGAFGFLAVALMLFSGTIWLPILMHGLTDFPMQFDTEVQYTKMVTGGGDWVGVGLEVLVYGLIGWVLISWNNLESRERITKWGKKAQLID
jgi:membrane protease YdiL (CAAX protease family)